MRSTHEGAALVADDVTVGTGAGHNGARNAAAGSRPTRPLVVSVDAIGHQDSFCQGPTLLEEPFETAVAGVAGGSPPQTMAEVLQPVPVEEFLHSTMGRSWVRLPGAADRFESLLPWSRFNAILRQTRLDPNRIRLMHDNVRLPVSKFLEEVPQLAPLGKPLRINTGVVEDYLRRGASLVLHAVDELVDEVDALTRSFERTLGTTVQVNAWVKYGDTEGIGPHWDDHDTFILQVAGVKQWKVHRPTFANPMPDDFGRPPAPTDDPVFDGAIHPGDFLYMPRGWWHEVSGLGCPTMHLTFGVRPPTGLSMLSLVRQRLHEHEVARADLPRFASDDDRRRYVADLRAALLEVLDDDFVTSFLSAGDARAQSRPHPSLPWAAVNDDLLEESVVVRLCTPRRLSVHAGPEAGQAEFVAGARRWVVSDEAVPMLDALARRQPLSVASTAGAAPGVESAVARQFLRALLDGGVIEAIAADDPPPPGGRATGSG